ncbi:hypothetical protein SASPL_133290 [Salvia splendens]|nr:hypothetical protein SASPL_133290 [Salvia splendens]
MRKGAFVSASTADLEVKLDAKIGKLEKLLTTVVEKVGHAPKPEIVCGVCGREDHTTPYCRVEEGQPMAQVNAAGDWQHRGQKRDPYAPTYNPGWRDHPNFKWNDPSQQIQGPPPQAHYQAPQGPNQGGNHA